MLFGSSRIGGNSVTMPTPPTTKTLQTERPDRCAQLQVFPDSTANCSSWRTRENEAGMQAYEE
jgi:hypothetical protein